MLFFTKKLNIICNVFVIQTVQPLIQRVRCLKREGRTIYFGRVKDSNEDEVLEVEWMRLNGMGREWRKRNLLRKNVGKWTEVFNK